MQQLLQSLRKFEEVSLNSVCVGALVDISIAVGPALLPYADAIMEVLHQALTDAKSPRDIKPPIISAMGDVAMAIGGAFEPYMQVSMMLLMQASTQAAAHSDDMEFLNALRCSVFEAYTGIIIGMEDGGKIHLFAVHVSTIMQFMERIASEPDRDPVVVSRAVDLAGDIARGMGSIPQVRQQLQNQALVQLVQEAVQSPEPGLRESANVAKTALQRALQA